jgi:hypothetical protein
MLREIEILGNFANSPECIRAFVHLLALSSGVVVFWANLPVQIVQMAIGTSISASHNIIII